MKLRHLVGLASTVAILWVRQLRFERRLSNRQGFWEREAERGLRHVLGQGRKEIYDGFAEFDRGMVRWSKELAAIVKKLSRGQL